jgi:hypothetical protein
MKNLMHSKFLIELGKYLQWKGYTVLHSQNDAGILIFKNNITLRENTTNGSSGKRH